MQVVVVRCKGKYRDRHGNSYPCLRKLGWFAVVRGTLPCPRCKTLNEVDLDATGVVVHSPVTTA